MSDLVKLVAKAVREAQQPWGDDYTPEARAAIKAVAEWLGAQENSDLSWASIEILQAQLEGSE